MNRISIFVLLLISLFSFVRQTEALPINLGKTAKTIFSIIGRATYYDVSAGLGSCGKMNSNNDLVVAINQAQMDNGANPNSNPNCNKKVKIVGVLGKSVTATVVDTCPGCAKGCLDMSSALFEKVCGSLDKGVCQISWDFI